MWTVSSFYALWTHQTLFLPGHGHPIPTAHPCMCVIVAIANLCAQNAHATATSRRTKGDSVAVIHAVGMHNLADGKLRSLYESKSSTAIDLKLACHLRVIVALRFLQ